MRLVMYDAGDGGCPGILVGERVVDTRAAAEFAGWGADMLAATASNRMLLSQPPDSMLELELAAAGYVGQHASASGIHPLDSVRLGPPVPDPEKIICIGLNYHDHAEEIGIAVPKEPIFFAKYANSLIGPTDAIVPPRDTGKVDYEAELAVVIGQSGRYISEEDALAHVAGAMNFNDVSARDLQLANQLWTGGKAVDTFGPCGPALVTLDELGDIQDLRVRTRVNGETLQDGTTARMVLTVTQLVAFLSRIMTLVPGDIIATGTPAGVAASHDPPRFLRTGDRVEVEVQGLGMTCNPVVDPA